MLSLNVFDRLIGWFSPTQAIRRGRARHALEVLADYEGGKPGRLRKSMREDRAPNQLVGASAARLRNYARHQERNLDLAKGALDVLVRNIVGPDGIAIEPMPRRLDGTVHQLFADQLMKLHRNWARRPEVTWQRDWAGTQRALARAWLRDGEAFAQFVEGSVAYVNHGTLVPLSLELLEADLVPLDFEDVGRSIRQGVELDAWKRARAFHVWKEHPGDSFLGNHADLKRVPAERMLHLALRDRLHQIRGVSVFASVVNRLEDLKDYEDYERAAAKIAAALTGVITRDGDLAATDAGALAAADSSSRAGLRIEAGMLWDGAPAGSKVEILKNERPTTQLEPFRNGQLRAGAAGVGATYSSLSKNYDGTYSAQRQELVEGWPQYRCLTREFVSQFACPTWERFVGLAVLSGQLKLPADLDVSTMTDAEYRGPAMPWIDPVKEAEANKTLVRSGFKSLTQVIRESGRDPWETLQQIKDERAEANRLGIQLESDPAVAAATARPDSDDDDTDGDPGDAQPPRQSTAAHPRAN
jgi:lambda family phage portal protein